MQKILCFFFGALSITQDSFYLHFLRGDKHESLPEDLYFLCFDIHGFCYSPGVTPWRRKRQPTPVFMPGKSHGPRSLVGYNPWGRKDLDTTWTRLSDFCVCGVTPNSSGCLPSFCVLQQFSLSLAAPAFLPSAVRYVSYSRAGLLALDSQSIGASASDLPMNTQG